MNEITAKIEDILIEILGCERGEIHFQSDIQRDLGADSLDAIEIVMAVEAAFNIDIEDEVLDRIRTVADLVFLVGGRQEGGLDNPNINTVSIHNDGSNRMDLKALLIPFAAIYEERGTIKLSSILVDGKDMTEAYAKVIGLVAICALDSELPDGRKIHSFFPEDHQTIYKKET